MKKLVYVALMLLLATTAVSCGGSSKSVSYKKGTVSKDVYMSEFIGLRFTLPDDFYMANELIMMQADEELEELILVNDKTVAEAEMEMMALGTAKGQVTLQVLVEKPVSISATEDLYLAASKWYFMGMDMEDGFDVKTTTMDFCGQSYYRIDATDTGIFAPSRQMILIRKIDDRLVYIAVTYMSGADKDLDLILCAFKEY